MKILFLLLIVSFSNYSCKSKKSNKEFEGTITFEVKHICSDVNFKERLIHTNGDKMVFYYKEGSFKREHYLNNELLRTTLYLAEQNKFYTYFPKLDTIFYNDASIINYEIDTTIIEINKDKILNYDCNYCFIKFSNDSIPWMNYELEWWGSEDIIIKENRFENINDGAMNLIFDNIKSIPIKYTMKNSKSTAVYTSIEVKQEQLEDNIFMLDQTKHLKEFK
jgi:hypothetical protein